MLGDKIVVKYVKFGNVDIGKQYTGYHGVPNMPYKNHQKLKVKRVKLGEKNHMKGYKRNEFSLTTLPIKRWDGRGRNPWRENLDQTRREKRSEN